MAAKTGKTCPSGMCDGCKQWSEWLELDHIIPRYRGGPHTRDNLQWLCVDCHKEKSSQERRAWRPSPEWIEHHRKVRTGKKHSPETREKMRQTHLRRNQDPEVRAKAGRRSPEALERLRELGHNQVVSEENRAKRSESMKAFLRKKRGEE